MKFRDYIISEVVANRKAYLYYGNKKLEDLGRPNDEELQKLYMEKVQFYYANGLKDLKKFKVKYS